MSENIFSSFYNKVLSFFQTEKTDGASTKAQATNRLKLVLMQDRSNLDGATMQKMREQLISVISKYIEIDQEALNLNLEAEGDEIALMLNIPVIRARTPEEIEELELADEEAKKEEIRAAIEAEKAPECDSEVAEESTETESSDETPENDNDEDVNVDKNDDETSDEQENSSEEISNEDNCHDESTQDVITSESEENTASKKSKKSKK